MTPEQEDQWLSAEAARKRSEAFTAIARESLVYLSNAQKEAQERARLEAEANAAAQQEWYRLQHLNSQTTLSFAGQNFGDNGAVALMRDLDGNQTLQMLDLSNNQITDIGARNIARFIRHCPTLKWLNLNNNQITDYGAQCIAKAIKHKTKLHFLNLSHNQISSTGVQYLLQAKNPALQIELNGNAFVQNFNAPVASAPQYPFFN